MKSIHLSAAAAATIALAIAASSVTAAAAAAPAPRVVIQPPIVISNAAVPHEVVIRRVTSFRALPKVIRARVLAGVRRAVEQKLGLKSGGQRKPVSEAELDGMCGGDWFIYWLEGTAKKREPGSLTVDCDGVEAKIP